MTNTWLIQENDFTHQYALHWIRRKYRQEVRGQTKVVDFPLLCYFLGFSAQQLRLFEIGFDSVDLQYRMSSLRTVLDALDFAIEIGEVFRILANPERFEFLLGLELGLQ